MKGRSLVEREITKVGAVKQAQAKTLAIPETETREGSEKWRD
jgi:hypothetical protein